MKVEERREYCGKQGCLGPPEVREAGRWRRVPWVEPALAGRCPPCHSLLASGAQRINSYCLKPPA